jgi:hypothetical protein
MNHKDILNKLPSSWQEMKLRDYLKVTDLEISEDDDLFNGVDNTLRVISALADVPVPTLEELPYPQIMDLAKHIEFISTLPKPTKDTKLQWKKVESIKYNDFVTFLALSKEPIQNLPTIIQTFSKKELSEEEVLDLDMVECYSGFFFLNKGLKKSFRRMIIYSSLKLIRQSVKMMWSALMGRIKRLLKAFKKSMAFTS